MSYELTGKLVAKYDTVQRTGTFKTREFAVEKTRYWWPHNYQLCEISIGAG
jgi:hypothetical protein